MNLSKGTIFMAISGLVGLAAMYAVHHYISGQTQVTAQPVGQVMIAAADLFPGAIITKTMVKSATWPQELIPPKAAVTPVQLEGRIINTPVSAGEPILLTRLAPEGAAAGLAGLLTEGKRALSVRVDDVSGVAGFIHPGDHVDVLMEMAKPGSTDHFSKTILQNIVVLSAGQTWEQGRDEKPAVVNTVTLVLTTAQAEIPESGQRSGQDPPGLEKPHRSGRADDPRSGYLESLRLRQRKEGGSQGGDSQPEECGNDQRAGAFPGQSLVFR